MMKNLWKLVGILVLAGIWWSGCEKKEAPTRPPVEKEVPTPAPVERQPPAGSTPGEQTSGQGKAQTVCPVMGGAINKQYFADYQGERVYFCCPACEESFKKDPGKYVEKMKGEGVVLEKAPVGM